jgi:hypothetical protein
MPVAGVLHNSTFNESRRRSRKPFTAETGYIERLNVTIEYRWAEDHNDICQRSLPIPFGGKWR